MDDELKRYLEGMEGRLHARVEKDLEAMEGRLHAHVGKAETNLLTAFHGWARSMEIRVRGVASLAMGFDERLALAEERISGLERKTAS